MIWQVTFTIGLIIGWFGRAVGHMLIEWLGKTNWVTKRKTVYEDFKTWVNEDYEDGEK